MIKKIVLYLSIFLLVSCASFSKKTTADKKAEENSKVSVKQKSNSSSVQVSSDLCKNENCPGYIK